jgi:sucrose phosphorylase
MPGSNGGAYRAGKTDNLYSWRTKRVNIGRPHTEQDRSQAGHRRAGHRNAVLDMQNRPQLITYADRFGGGTFRDLQRLLAGPLQGVFGGVHVLPFYHPIDGADAGFDPIDHTMVDPRLGSWDDVAALAAGPEVMADLIVNHISSRSPQFVDYHQRGDESPYAGMFLTFPRVFPHGARAADLVAISGPRPALPFTRHRNGRGRDLLLWTTFTSEQIDIDVTAPQGRRYLSQILARLHAAGVRIIRLDAVGYAIKKAGTSCFMIPETFAFISDLTAEAHALGLDVLVEVHGHHQAQIDVARQVDWVYDFALPPLILHTLYTRDIAPLLRWLEIRPHNAVTVLDTHDGIGVSDVAGDPERELPGLLPPAAVEAVIDGIHERSRGESRQASGTSSQNVDSSQINCTFYDALGRRDDEYLVARAIQCFVPGIPQIYYVGLLAGTNDLHLLRRTGVGRDINRRYYTQAEVEEALRGPVVTSLLSLLRLRNSHPAFQGTFQVDRSGPDQCSLTWEAPGSFARLDVNLDEMHASVTCSPRVPPRSSEADSSGPVWRSLRRRRS